MTILDTTVLLEVQKARPNPSLLVWLDAQDPTNLYLTAITAGVYLYGAAGLGAGPRKGGLGAAMNVLLDPDFAGRVLSYDRAAAGLYRTRVAAARQDGVSIGQAVGQIAAIALARGAPVATRTSKPFEALGLEVIDAWRFER